MVTIKAAEPFDEAKRAFPSGECSKAKAVPSEFYEDVPRTFDQLARKGALLFCGEGTCRRLLADAGLALSCRIAQEPMSWDQYLLNDD